MLGLRLRALTVGRPIAFDRNKLHALLWHRGGRRHVYAGNLRMLAAETGISYFHLTRIIQEFVKESRLHSLSRGNHRLQSFRVEDPVYWNIAQKDLAGAEIAKAELDALSEASRPYQRKVAEPTEAVGDAASGEPDVEIGEL